MAIRAIHVLFSFILLFSSVVHAAIIVKNSCQQTIWPATLTSGSGQSQLSTTGFELASGATKIILTPTPWTGRIWARTQCFVDGSSRFSCATGDCTLGSMSCNGAGGIPPVTLAEFTLAPNGGVDFYDVSLVDGFNLPLSITAFVETKDCQSTTCSANLNLFCPPELQLKTGNGNVVGCKSACVAFNTPEYCCSGSFSDPNKCQHSQYSLLFKSYCPQAYSYAYDDQTSTFTCRGEPDYLVTFCP